jgi:hypothetical protein
MSLAAVLPMVMRASAPAPVRGEPLMVNEA